MPITGIYTKDFPDLGRDAGATDLIPIVEVGNIVTKKTPVSGLITNARVVGALGFIPYNATNPAGYITSASLEPLEFNTFDRTVWNNGKGNVATNTSFGEFALSSNTSGQNTAFGFQALKDNTSGGANTAFGFQALRDITSGSSNNTALGADAGLYLSTVGTNTICNNSVFLGSNARALDNNQTNQIVIGYNAIGLGSNTATLGNELITITRLRGEVRGGSFVKDGGTSTQFLKANGSVDSNSYALASSLTGYVTLDTSQTITGAKFFTGFLTGLRASFESSGSSNTFAINHTSGSGIALNILKDGNGEGLTIVKGSGSGNAASITGGITLLSELNLTTKLADAHIASATVWNAKIGGSGTTNFLAKFTASGVVGNSVLQEVNGNLGLGVTPSGWGASMIAIQIGNGGSIFNWSGGNLGNVNIGSNNYDDGEGAQRYINSSVGAALYGQNNGQHQWLTAPSGTAGNAISFTQAMTLGANGNVLIGTTTDAGFKLDVNGSLRANTRVNFASLPTSATGLVSGDLWRNGTVINIVA